jgi:hypothetical protein
MDALFDEHFLTTKRTKVTKGISEGTARRAPTLRLLRLCLLSFVLFVTFVVKACSHWLRCCRAGFLAAKSFS